jgi:hypothetical protein
MAGHSKGGEGLKRAVVPQKKKEEEEEGGGRRRRNSINCSFFREIHTE